VSDSLTRREQLNGILIRAVKSSKKKNSEIATLLGVKKKRWSTEKKKGGRPKAPFRRKSCTVSRKKLTVTAAKSIGINLRLGEVFPTPQTA